MICENTFRNILFNNKKIRRYCEENLHKNGAYVIMSFGNLGEHNKFVKKFGREVSLSADLKRAEEVIEKFKIKNLYEENGVYLTNVNDILISRQEKLCFSFEPKEIIEGFRKDIIFAHGYSSIEFYNTHWHYRNALFVDFKDLKIKNNKIIKIKKRRIK